MSTTFIDLKAKGKTEVVIEFTYARDAERGRVKARLPQGGKKVSWVKFVTDELNDDQSVYSPTLGGPFYGNAKNDWTWVLSVAISIVNAFGGVFDEYEVRNPPPESAFRVGPDRGSEEGVIY